MLQLFWELIKKALFLQTPVLFRFILLAFLCMELINQSWHSWAKALETMAAYGFPGIPLTHVLHIRFQGQIETISLKINIRLSAILFRVMLLHGMLKNSAIWAKELVKQDWLYIWILKMQSREMEKRKSPKNTATCFRCMKRLQEIIPMKFQWGFILLFTTQWAVCGWTTTLWQPFPAFLPLERQTFRIMAQTGWAPAL